MLDTLKKYFEKSPEPAAPEVKAEADGNRILVATCAVFLEMAHIDNEFSEEERDNIFKILKSDFHLSDKDADAIFETAAKERKDSVDMWQFTNLINENYSRTEKKEVLTLLWKLVYVDGVVDKHEEYLTRKMTNLRRLNHSDFIEAKLKAK